MRHIGSTRDAVLDVFARADAMWTRVLDDEGDGAWTRRDVDAPINDIVTAAEEAPLLVAATLDDRIDEVLGDVLPMKIWQQPEVPVMTLTSRAVLQLEFDEGTSLLRAMALEAAREGASTADLVRAQCELLLLLNGVYGLLAGR